MGNPSGGKRLPTPPLESHPRFRAVTPIRTGVAAAILVAAASAYAGGAQQCPPSSSGIASPATVCGTPLKLTDSKPASGAINVPRRMIPLLAFSANLDPATANSKTISLRDASGDRDITVQVSGRRLAIAPTHALSALTPYTLTVSTGLRGSSGEALSTPVIVTFETADVQLPSLSATE